MVDGGLGPCYFESTYLKGLISSTGKLELTIYYVPGLLLWQRFQAVWRCSDGAVMKTQRPHDLQSSASHWLAQRSLLFQCCQGQTVTPENVSSMDTFNLEGKLPTGKNVHITDSRCPNPRQCLLISGKIYHVSKGN